MNKLHQKMSWNKNSKIEDACIAAKTYTFANILSKEKELLMSGKFTKGEHDTILYELNNAANISVGEKNYSIKFILIRFDENETFCEEEIQCRVLFCNNSKRCDFEKKYDNAENAIADLKSILYS